MKKRIFTTAALLLLSVVLLFAGCDTGNSSESDNKNNSSQNSSTVQTSSQGNDTSSGGDTSASATQGSQASSGGNTTSSQNVKKSNYVRPSRSTGKYVTIADQTDDPKKDLNYDLKVSTFDVGSFYHSVDTGMHADGQYGEWVPGALKSWNKAIKNLDADIYGLQQFCPLFYESKKDKITISSKDQFASVFKTLKIGTGTSFDGNYNMYVGFASTKASAYDVKNVTYGYLSAGTETYRRLYARGEITVAGKNIAVYSVHLFNGNYAVMQDAITELISKMDREDYCICMGDFQTNEIASAMASAGYQVANGGKFGNFSTYEYNDGYYYDNIFTSNNIDIQFVECESSKRAGSDHAPLSAYLKINTAKGSAKKAERFHKGTDGFFTEWFRP